MKINNLYDLYHEQMTYYESTMDQFYTIDKVKLYKGISKEIDRMNNDIPKVWKDENLYNLIDMLKLVKVVLYNRYKHIDTIDLETMDEILSNAIINNNREKRRVDYKDLWNFMANISKAYS